MSGNCRHTIDELLGAVCNSQSYDLASNHGFSFMQAALSVKGWERLPRDEIVIRACQAVAAVAHEKSRNAELVYRLQQTHEEGIETRQLKGRFAELQVSHCYACYSS